jgi:CubicO group peptidase (beta-lactamase class C family)
MALEEERMRLSVRAPIALLLGMAVVSAACERREEDLERPYVYSPPLTTADGWATDDLASHGIETAPIEALVRSVRDGTFTNIHGILLVRHGRLLLEEYFAGMGVDTMFTRYDRDTLHELASVTKSVNATLVGIGLCEGWIAGLDEPVSSYFREYPESAADAAKQQIRLRHLLTMTAGLAWDESSYPYGDPRNSFTSLDASPQPIRFLLQQPLVTPPGRQFVYNSGLSITLGGVVARLTEESTDAFAARRLFAPLGITAYEWRRYKDGTVQTGGGLSLRPRDMAKIGQLHLDGGTWSGRQVVCPEWVEMATAQQVEGVDYGYQWWLTRFDNGGTSERSFYASGRGGQFIFVLPELSLVAVFTGGNTDERYLQPFDMMKRYVLPAVH